MKNKLKELSKYCCKPANENEYEFIKTCARLGGVDINDSFNKVVYFNNIYKKILFATENYDSVRGLTEIPVTQFCDILLKDESEFDDRVYVMDNSWLVDNGKSLTACGGYKFRLSEDCQTVEMVKDTKCGFCVKPKNEER